MNPYRSAGEGRRQRRQGQRTLDLPSPLVEELRTEAARLGRSPSALVQLAWRISRGMPAERPPPAAQPWEAVAGELTRRIGNPAKRRAASRAWLQFEAWCAEQGAPACPAADETLRAYARARLAAGAGSNELVRAVAAIAVVHRARGRPVPRLRPSAKAALEQLAAGEGKPR